MLRQGREMGLNATAPQKASATKMMPEMNTVSESARTASSVSPSTESEIATVAYQLWLHRGCPIGSSQEDWFRAEAMLKNALLWGDSFSRPLIPCCNPRTESEMVPEFDLEVWGHWEVWEREYGARWVWDFRGPGVGGLNRARPSGKAA